MAEEEKDLIFLIQETSFYVQLQSLLVPHSIKHSEIKARMATKNKIQGVKAYGFLWAEKNVLPKQYAFPHDFRHKHNASQMFLTLYTELLRD